MSPSSICYRRKLVVNRHSTHRSGPRVCHKGEQLNTIILWSPGLVVGRGRARETVLPRDWCEQLDQSHFASTTPGSSSRSRTRNRCVCKLDARACLGFSIGARLKGRRSTARDGVLGRGKTPSPPTRGSEERCGLPSWVLGGAPTAQRFSTILSTYDGLSCHYNIVNMWTNAAIGGKTGPVPPLVYAPGQTPYELCYHTSLRMEKNTTQN